MATSPAAAGTWDEDPAGASIVLATGRARHDLLLTGSHLTGRATAPRPMSRFLAELVRRDLVDAYGPGLQDYDEDLPNPLVASGATGTWPPPEPPATGRPRR